MWNLNNAIDFFCLLSMLNMYFLYNRMITNSKITESFKFLQLGRHNYNEDGELYRISRTKYRHSFSGRFDIIFCVYVCFFLIYIFYWNMLRKCFRCTTR